MVTELQFVAVAAYLLWCLFSSLTGLYGSDEDGAEQVQEINAHDKNDKITTPQ